MVRRACRLMPTRLLQRRKICVYLHWKLFPIQKCSTTFSPRNKSLSLSPISHLPNSAAISPRSRCWRPQISRSRPKCKHRALVTRPWATHDRACSRPSSLRATVTPWGLTASQDWSKAIKWGGCRRQSATGPWITVRTHLLEWTTRVCFLATDLTTLSVLLKA